MCTVNQLKLITEEVARLSKNVLEEKLDSVILYGSYARGDYDKQSDVDMMILAHIPPETCWKYTESISDGLTDTELSCDVLVSVHVVSADLFKRYSDDLPFYRNVDREGIRIAV